MALIGMAVFDTLENNRSWMTRKTLESLAKTVDWSKHRLICSDNGSCPETFTIYKDMQPHIPGMAIITNGTNLGTARAINRAWLKRKLNENCVKIDNDVVIHEAGWLDKLEKCIQRDPAIGIIGLKRKDLREATYETGWAQSSLIMLPHNAGQEWLIVEKVAHVMGTCQLYSAALLDKIGFLYQMGGLYGFDDSISAIRSLKAGFYSCFWPHVEIDHIDPGANAFTDWKRKYAGEHMSKWLAIRNEYINGRRNIYHGPNDD